MTPPFMACFVAILFTDMRARDVAIVFIRGLQFIHSSSLLFHEYEQLFNKIEPLNHPSDNMVIQRNEIGGKHDKCLSLKVGPIP